MNHKFLITNFQNEFETHNAILDVTPYDPEVIFIGTFNHGWPWNPSDFFYGRGMYMWTILGNLFLHNQNKYSRQRTHENDTPSFTHLFEICEKGKIVFGDIVKGIINGIPNSVVEGKKEVLVNKSYVWNDYKDKHLEYMGKEGWLDDNVNAIIDFINSTPTIEHIYFTFKSGNWLNKKSHDICNGVRKEVKTCSIFTPTANGFGKNLTAPYNERAFSLAHCWVWNGMENKYQINKSGYGHLDHNWLKRNGVYPNNF